MIERRQPVSKLLRSWVAANALNLSPSVFLPLALLGQSLDPAKLEDQSENSNPGAEGSEAKKVSEKEKPIPRKAIRIPLEGDDRFTKNGVEYRKQWGFRAGVARFYPPLYIG